MSTDNKDVYIDKAAVEEVDRKIRQSTAMTRGVMSSWSNPMDGLESGPMGKVTKPKVEPLPEFKAPGLAHLAQAPAMPGIVKVPAQAMKSFKRVLAMCESIEVKLTPEQAHMLYDAVSGMAPPKNMGDARAIVNLMESLEKIKS